MGRRAREYHKEIISDRKYNSPIVYKFINKLMKHGKKSIAENIVYTSIEQLAQKVSKKPLEAFEDVIRNVSPIMEVKSRRVGGSTYQVPIEVKKDRAVSLAMRWLIENARKRSGKDMIDRLTHEFIDAFNKIGNSIKKKDETHKMAESNKAFAHFRY